MKLRYAGKLAMSVLGALTVAVVASQPAAAHEPSASARVYDTYGLCTISWAQISHDHTANLTTSRARTIAMVNSCTTIDVFAPGWLAVRLDLQRWNGSGWANCQSTNWVYNTTWTNEVSTSKFWGYGWPDCVGTANDGPGYFRTQSVSYVWDGAAWRGGATQSSYHPLTA